MIAFSEPVHLSLLLLDRPGKLVGQVCIHRQMASCEEMTGIRIVSQRQFALDLLAVKRY